MEYRVELSRRAEYELAVLFLEKNAAESKAAARWFNRIEDAIYALEHSPQRGLVIPEARSLKRDLRHLLFGKRTNARRIIDEVDEHGRAVLVLTIRHGSTKRVNHSDLD